MSPSSIPIMACAYCFLFFCAKYLVIYSKLALYYVSVDVEDESLPEYTFESRNCYTVQRKSTYSCVHIDTTSMRFTNWMDKFMFQQIMRERERERLY